MTSARWQYALLLGAVGGSIGAVAMLLLVGATGDVLVRLGVFASVTALVVHVASIRSIARPVDAMLELLSIGVIAFVVAEPILQFLADAGFATGPSELGARSAVYAATTAVGLVVVRAAHLRHAPARASFLRPIAR